VVVDSWPSPYLSEALNFWSTELMLCISLIYVDILLLEQILHPQKLWILLIKVGICYYMLLEWQKLHIKLPHSGRLAEHFYSLELVLAGISCFCELSRNTAQICSTYTVTSLMLILLLYSNLHGQASNQINKIPKFFWIHSNSKSSSVFLFLFKICWDPV
jgi:hypothetical protein